MAALHTALQSLGPTPFSAIPQDRTQTANYLQNVFKEAQKIIDSVPLPPPTDPIVAVSTTARQRSATLDSLASNVSEISSSSARSDPIDPSNVNLQKEWGKPIKLGAKENPLGMAVYKLAGKDGKGAWFARRSVHEGLSFKKWKLGLQREFPETLQVQGAPGEGNIRGIGGERRVERIAVDGCGTIEVYHLSAQFPGPTAPRDFVTLLLTSGNALSESSSSSQLESFDQTTQFINTPKHFMVISRPCDHPECPPRDGFVRGHYESVEFIREVPVTPKRSSSTLDLPKLLHSSPSIEREAIVRNALQKAGESSESLPNGNHLSATAEGVVRGARPRGKTISFAGTRGSSAKGEKLDNPHLDEDDAVNPVEWIMVTRSDPGGSVPRFMVERGTPNAIVADARKFLDWACKKEHSEDEIEALEKGDVDHVKEETREELDAFDTNGHLAGLDGATENKSEVETMLPAVLEGGVGTAAVQETHSGSLMASVTNAAYTSVESYAPQAVVDFLPGHQQTLSLSSNPIKDVPPLDSLPPRAIDPSASTPSLASTSSLASFASAEDHFDTQSTSSQTKSQTSKDASSASKEPLSPHEKELRKLNDRKRALDRKLATLREKETSDKGSLTSKEGDRIRKAEERHAKELTKQEEKYRKEIAKIEARRAKEAVREAARIKKAEEKDERGRLAREREGLRSELAVVRAEVDILRERVGELQRENTALVVRLGKVEGGRDLLREVRDGGRDVSRDGAGGGGGRGVGV